MEEQLLKDPSITDNYKSSVIIFILSMVFLVVYHYTAWSWMAFLAWVWLWFIFVISIIVFIGMMILRMEINVEKSYIKARLPKWYIYLTGIIGTIALWCTFPPLFVTMYFISKSILSINYMVALEGIDRKFTEKVKSRQKLKMK